MIGQSILWIIGIMEIAETANSRPQSRRRRDSSITLMMQRSGVRYIAPQDTIWRSARLFWIVRRCQHLKWRRSHVKENIVE
jgi:hypothetical protein